MAKDFSFSDKRLQKALRDPSFNGWDAELVAAFSHWADEEMVKQLTKELRRIPRIRDKVKRAVEIRLDILSPYKQHVKTATKAMAHLPHNRHMPKLVWQSADRIWNAVGDTATDYNRYTKRLLLSGVLTATVLYWLRDSSKNDEKTLDFLDRRIDNVMTVGKFMSRFKKSA